VHQHELLQACDRLDVPDARMWAWNAAGPAMSPGCMYVWGRVRVYDLPKIDTISQVRCWLFDHIIIILDFLSEDVERASGT